MPNFDCYATDEPTDCKNGDFRLRGGTDKSNGLVETCQDKQWIAVCNDNFDLKKAQYVCKQLFDAQGIYILHCILFEVS